MPAKTNNFEVYLLIYFLHMERLPRSGYITVRDQSLVESGVTKGGKNTDDTVNILIESCQP